VLEHIPDDRRAMSELVRVLSPGGIAFVEVPVLTRVTYEDWSLTSEAERTLAFGQKDHVRLCGLDYAHRLSQAGLAVEDLWIDEQFTRDEVASMRLCAEESEGASAQPPRREGIFHVAWLCRKTS
jgi:hypothetical protein